MASAYSPRELKPAGSEISEENKYRIIYKYIEQYQRELKTISQELGRDTDREGGGFWPRKNWAQYKTEATLKARFYQGEYVYFNPDNKSRTDKKVDYYAVNYVLHMLKERGCKQLEIAGVCNVTPAIVSGWTTGREYTTVIDGEPVRDVRVKDAIRDNFEYHPNIHPNKYQWWAIGIRICLPATLLDPFLMMVGAVFEPFRMEDQIIYDLMRPTLGTRYDPSKHSALNIKEILKKNMKAYPTDGKLLDRELCQDALLAFNVIQRPSPGKTKGKTESTND